MAINKEKVYNSTGFQAPIVLSRHNQAHISVGINLSATATVTVQGTLSQINRSGVTAIWFDIPALTAVTADTFDKIVDTPLEAVRMNITAITGTVTFQVAQNT